MTSKRDMDILLKALKRTPVGEEAIRELTHQLGQYACTKKECVYVITVPHDLANELEDAANYFERPPEDCIVDGIYGWLYDVRTEGKET